MAKRVNQSANVKMMVYAIRKPANVNVQKVCNFFFFLVSFFEISSIDFQIIFFE